MKISSLVTFSMMILFLTFVQAQERMAGLDLDAKDAIRALTAAQKKKPRPQKRNESSSAYFSFLLEKTQDDVLVFVPNQKISATDAPNGIIEGNVYSLTGDSRIKNEEMLFLETDGTPARLIPIDKNNEKFSLELGYIEHQHYMEPVKADSYVAQANVASEKNTVISLVYSTKPTVGAKPEQILDDTDKGTFFLRFQKNF